MNHDTTTADSRLPPKELTQHGWKRTWNDESTLTRAAGRTGRGGRTTNGRTGSSSKRARCSILEQFGSISVRDDDDMDNDEVADNSFSASCAADNGNGSSMVDGFSTENDDEGDDRQLSSGPEDDIDDEDDDDELLSDDELLRRRLEKQVYVSYSGGE
jgi:hypothetical protein